jgi:hypothetical protein
MTTWHLDADLADRYSEGRVGHVLAASVEQHLTACGDCRGMIHADPSRLDAVWDEVLDLVEAPHVGFVERAVRRLGASEPTARLLAATPSLRGAWLTGVVVVIGLALVAAHVSPRGFEIFMALAPVLPMLGVAWSFGPQADPTLEIAAASPYSLVRLLLARTSFVVGTTLLPTAVAGFFVPGQGWPTIGWLLPSLAMCSVVLATAQRFEPHLSAAGLSAAWIAVIVWSAVRDTVLLSDHGLTVQLLSVVVLLAAGWSLATHRLEPHPHRRAA